MKNSILTLFTVGFLMTMNTNLSAQLSFGAGTSLNLDSQITVGLQGKALYKVTETINASGAFTYFLDSPGNMMAIDLDGQYSLLTFGEGGTLAPLAGINILRFSFDEFSTSTTNINLGAFITMPVSAVNIYIEPKITIGDSSSFFVAAGILF